VPLLDAPGGALAERLQAARALGARHRRLAAAVCAGAAVLAVVSALTPAAPAPTSAEAGRGGLTPITLPPGAGAGAVDGAGRVAVTVRLADAAGTLLLRPGIHVEVIGGAPAGSAAAADGSATTGGSPTTDGAAATDGAADDAVVLAADAVVLVVPQPGNDGSGGGSADGSLFAGGGPASTDSGLEGVAVLSVPPADAHRLAAAAGTRPVSVAVALPAS
jgi:hypothetical protein